MEEIYLNGNAPAMGLEAAGKRKRGRFSFGLEERGLEHGLGY